MHLLSLVLLLNGDGASYDEIFLNWYDHTSLSVRDDNYFLDVNCASQDIKLSKLP